MVVVSNQNKIDQLRHLRRPGTGIGNIPPSLDLLCPCPSGIALPLARSKRGLTKGQRR